MCFWAGKYGNMGRMNTRSEPILAFRFLPFALLAMKNPANVTKADKLCKIDSVTQMPVKGATLLFVARGRIWSGQRVGFTLRMFVISEPNTDDPGLQRQRAQSTAGVRYGSKTQWVDLNDLTGYRLWGYQTHVKAAHTLTVHRKAISKLISCTRFVKVATLEVCALRNSTREICPKIGLECWIRNMEYNGCFWRRKVQLFSGNTMPREFQGWSSPWKSKYKYSLYLSRVL